MEYVKSEPCKEYGDVKKFYNRIGMLSCITYVLFGSDYHYENIIASGDQPIFIDNETLMNPMPGIVGPNEFMESAHFKVQELLISSVLRSYIFPRWQIGVNNDTFDVSGLGGFNEQFTSIYSTTWQEINTDEMKFIQSPTRIPVKENLPVLEENQIFLNEELADELIAGFKIMYQELMSRIDQLLAGPIKKFEGVRIRFVFRNSRLYASLLSAIQNPKYMRDGIDFGLSFERLAVAFLKQDEKPNSWNILSHEISSLYNLDIPFLTSFTNSKNLFENNKLILCDFFSESSYSISTDRISKLCKDDREVQVEIIKGSIFSSLYVDKSDDYPKNIQKRSKHNFEPITKKSLIAEAVSLANQLARKAIVGQDGSISWITPKYSSQVDRFQLLPADYSLYDGLCGTAVFYSALSSVCDANYRKFAYNSLKTLRKHLNLVKSTPTILGPLKSMGIGGTNGLGGIIYSLTLVGRYLGDDCLIGEAENVVSLIDNELIGLDTKFDVIDGASGLLLSLLALYSITKKQAILDKAEVCGEKLCQGLNYNLSTQHPQMTGFSHGASGISLALLRLFSFTHDTRYYKKAFEAIGYEMSVYNKERRNWLDYYGITQGKVSERFKVAWCHGAAGIGLARLGCLPYCNNIDIERVRNDIQSALQTTIENQRKRNLSTSPDHLCCGNFGRIEFLYNAGLNDFGNNYVTQSLIETSKIVEASRVLGGYYSTGALPRGMFASGFFHGISGIGYELLRLAHPDKLKVCPFVGVK